MSYFTCPFVNTDFIVQLMCTQYMTGRVNSKMAAYNQPFHLSFCKRLMWAFVFAMQNDRFSHDAAYISHVMRML